MRMIQMKSSSQFEGIAKRHASSLFLTHRTQYLH